MRRSFVRGSLFPVTVLLAAGPIAAQNGLLGQYFNSAFPPGLQVGGDFERIDPFVDFNWPGDAPSGTTIISDDQYSERWTGWVRTEAAGLWTFTLASNDGARLWIDGQLVVNDWSVHPTRELSGSITLQAGWHPLRLEHFNQGGTALIRLLYQGPGQPRIVIPNGDLCSDIQCLGIGSPEFAVDAGPDHMLAPTQPSVRLNGRIQGVKHSNIPSPYDVEWSQISGPPAVIENAGRLDAAVSASEPGIVRLRLDVQDNAGNAASDEAQVLVLGGDQDAVITGEARKWHKLALTFQHTVALTENGTPNPFLDLRLITFFLHPETDTLYGVPGFFAADGNAAETGATGGNKWRTNFTPDQAGTWYYMASFRSGSNIAVEADGEAGTPLSFDGANGFFEVAPTDPEAGGFLSKGRLEYVGGHYLRCAETGEFFLKGGTNSPENFLGYYEFDNTFDQGGSVNDLDTQGALDGLHHFDAHLADYVDRGVPTWRSGKGRRIFGALDYLASRGVNSLYALTFNTDGGDGREVWPWVNSTNKLRYDVSKLAQWELVIDHMMRAGIAWHAMTQETENDQVLDFGALGVERKLYYRELIARFGHAPALIWNLGEENSNTPEERKAFADFLHAFDPYDHPVALHNISGTHAQTYGPLLGTHLEIVSLQGDLPDASDDTQAMRDDSAEAGRPWVVNYDEQSPPNDGAVPDSADFAHDVIRKNALWPNLMAGGGGCEWYFGYAHPHSDLDCEDFRSRDNLWLQTTRAREFLLEHLPFDEMEHADSLSALGSFTLAQRGEFYAVYLPNGGSTQLNLESNAAPFSVSWFDCANGGALQPGTVSQVTGPGVRSLGSPPGAPGNSDWVAFVRRAANLPPELESVRVEPTSFSGGNFALLVRAGDPNGPSDPLLVTVSVFDPQGTFFNSFTTVYRGGNLYSRYFENLAPLASGTWTLEVSAEDASGASDTLSGSFEAP